MKSFLLVFSLLLPILFSSPFSLASGIQYCRNEPSFCFAVVSVANGTAGGHDIHISLAATSRKSGGWVGVGIGKKMAGSLMFLLYSDQERKMLTTSIRTVESHDNPSLLKDHGHHVEMIEGSISATGYHARFVCYSCDSWWKTAMSTGGKTSFIYAVNNEQKFTTAASESVLRMHNAYGIVEGDMNKALVRGSSEPIPTVRPGETIGFVLTNENGKKKSATGSSSKETSWLSSGNIHGLIMTVAFMGLFIPGGIIIQLPISRAFKYHWIIQVCASLMAFGSAAYMVTQSTHLDLHKILGLTVVGSLAAQAAVGYKHHQVFVQVHQQSSYTAVHRWLGRGLLFLGSLNVALGLSHSRQPMGAIVAWFIIWIAEIAGYIWVLRRKRHNTNRLQQGRQLVPKDEPENGLIGSAAFALGDLDSSDSDEDL